MDCSEPTSVRARTRPLDIFAVCVGNSVEWFEIVVYGYFAAVLSNLFFPSTDPNIALLSFFATFGITFLVRPLGALLLGAYADRHGRKNGLLASAIIMALGCALIAILPTYQTIGLAAPVFLVLARCLQGFAVGGEFGSATAFLAEQDPARRGYIASWQFASQSASAILATGTAATITFVLTQEQIVAWGWRIPFLLGILLMPYAIYLRNNLSETDVFKRARIEPSPARALWRQKRVPFFVACGLLMFGTVGTYTIIFLSAYAIRRLSLDPSAVFAVGFATACVQAIAVPVFGHVSDLCRRRVTVSVISALLALLVSYPLFSWLVLDPTVARLAIVQICFGTLVAAYAAPLPALLSELFPPNTRTTGLSLSYALTVALFGGFAPFIETWLSQELQSKVAPFYYVVFSALISLACTVLVFRSVPARARP